MASALVSAMNAHTSTQEGENGCTEYGWSNDIREEIVQLSFQTVRTSEEGVRNLGERLYSIASRLQNINSETDISNYLYDKRDRNLNDLKAKNDEANELLDVLRRMVVQTRDIEAGKGEYSLGREFIRQWYRLFPSEALKMIKYYVTPVPDYEKGTTTHPYGSWKDIKFLWRVFGGENCPTEVLGYLVRLVNNQLHSDLGCSKPSLVARWVSRENASKKNSVPFREFYHALAEDYFSHYMATARTPESRERARRKCYTHYRQKVLVPLNKQLRTPQVKQCSGRWSEIDYKNDVTSITMRKQTRAFMNEKKDGTVRSRLSDRVRAAENFDKFVTNAAEKGETIKGKRVGFDVIAQDGWNMAVRHNQYNEVVSETEKNVLNLQWESMLESLGELDDMVPMIDLSGSMCGDPMNAAMGIGLAVASKSRVGKCAMTFSSSPVWMNFEGCSNLTEMMREMYKFRNDWGGSTNFTASLKLILDKCVKLKLPASEVANIKLLVLSDMQIDSYGNEAVNRTMWDNITQLYADAGRRAVGEPYTPGHIIFWNLRSTNGFPVLSTTPNTTMFAGFSPVLLNEFAKKGLEALKNETPFKHLMQQLDSPRYSILDFA